MYGGIELSTSGRAGIDRVSDIGRIILATVLGALLLTSVLVPSWLLYKEKHSERITRENRRQALTRLDQQTKRSRDESLRALRESSAHDVDALAGIIARHTDAHLLAYDASRGRFTATAEWKTEYALVALWPGITHDRLNRCVVLTFTHGPGVAWTGRTDQQDQAECEPARAIGSLAAGLRRRLSQLEGEDLTDARVREVLAVGSKVERVTADRGVLRAEVILFDRAKTVGQCYRFTRPLTPERAATAETSTTAVPLPSCSGASAGDD